MPKRILIVPALVATLCLLLSHPVMAQPKDEGDRLFEEALEIENYDRSNEGREKAVDKYEKALSIYRDMGDLKSEGQILFRLGTVYTAWGQYAKAVEYYEKSLAIEKNVGDVWGERLTLNHLGLVYYFWNQYAKAAEHYEKDLSICRKLGDASGERTTLKNLGKIYNAWGQYAKAADYYEKSLETAKNVDDVRGEGDTLENLGKIYTAWGQYARAVDYFEKSLSIFRELKDPKGEGDTLNNLGKIYTAWSQYAKAVEYYEKSLGICREFKDPEGEGISLNNLGNVYSAWGQYAKAVEYYEKSLSICRELKDPKGEGISLNNLGNVYSAWGQYAKAVEYYEKSLSIFRELKDPKEEGESFNNLGNVYSGWSQHEKALEYHEKSLAVAREFKNRKPEANALLSLGMVFWNWGQYDKALQYYEKSLAICRELNDRKGEATSLNNLGLVYKDWGQYSKAVEYFEKSLGTFRELNDRKGEATSLNNLGNVYDAWGQYAKAMEYYEKSLGIFRELKDPKGEGDTLNNLGNVYDAWGQYAKAVEYYEKSLEIAEKGGDVGGEGAMLNNLGLVYATQGKYSQALTNFQEALEIYKRISVPTDLATNNIGNLYLDRGEVGKGEPFIREGNYRSSLGRLSLLKRDYPGAKEYYEELRQSAEKNRGVDNLFTAYTGLGTASEGMGDDKQAEGYFQKAVNLTEELRSTLPKAQRETFFDVRINGFLRTAPYDGLARVRIKLNKPVEAFKDSEEIKSRVFAEAMSKRSESTSFDIRQDILTKDREINDQLGALKKKRQEGYEKANQEIISVIEPQVQEMEQKFQTHKRMLREKYPLFAATKYPEPLDLSQTALKDNERVLAYHVTDPGIIIYLAEGKKLKKAFFKPIPRKELDALVRKFRKPLEIALETDDTWEKIKKKFRNKLGSFDFSSGRELSRILLDDVLPEIPPSHPLIVVPDDCLAVLPFEMLVLNTGGKVKTEERNGEIYAHVSKTGFFGDRNILSYYQSITALTLARTLGKQQKPGERTLAMVDPVFASDDPRLGKITRNKGQEHTAPNGRLSAMRVENGMTWPRLELTTQLGEYLGKEWDPLRTDVYDGMKAQKSVLLEKDLTGYRSIVFGTHGYYGNDLATVQEPVLVLTLVDQPKGEDGFLRLTEVMGLKLNCEIAALTACQTGLGRTIAGEGTMGMGRAFQYAGGKSVLMSLWSVSEMTSIALVKSFFRHLKEGKNRLEALRLARQDIRTAGYDHPFFWAPFILVGEVD